MTDETKKAWVVVICWALATVLVVWFLFFGPGEAFGFPKGFKLYASTTSGSYSDAAVVTFGWNDDNQVTWTPPTSETYYFVVTAFDGGGESENSEEVSHACTADTAVTLAWDYGKCVRSFSVYDNCTRKVSLNSSANPMAIDPGSGGSVAFDPQRMYGDNVIEMGASDVIEMGADDSITFSRH